MKTIEIISSADQGRNLRHDQGLRRVVMSRCQQVSSNKPLANERTKRSPPSSIRRLRSISSNSRSFNVLPIETSVGRVIRRAGLLPVAA